MAKNLILHFVTAGRHIEVGEAARAGAAPDNDICLSDFFRDPLKTISRYHFRLVRRPDGYAIVDLGSTNSTAVNGEPLMPNIPRPLAQGDRIVVARTDSFAIEVILTDEDVVFTTDPNATNIKLDRQGRPIQAPPAGLFLDRDRLQFVLDGIPVPHPHLTKQEFQLLTHLYDNAGRVCTYHELGAALWDGWWNSNTISKTVAKLREKMNAIAPETGERYIITVRGQGYQCRLD